MLLSDIDGPDAVQEISERILSVLQKAMYFDGLELKPSASVGVAIYPHNGSSAKELLESADKAMYSNKQENRPA